mgnify:CR=1 FL=1
MGNMIPFANQNTLRQKIYIIPDEDQHIYAQLYRMIRCMMYIVQDLDRVKMLYIHNKCVMRLKIYDLLMFQKLHV